MEVVRPNYDEVLKTVETWPADQRLTLVQDILKTLTLSSPQSRPRHSTLKRALGLLETAPPPSDEQVQQWIDERRMEKYS